MNKKIKILSIGHSYTIALNRSIMREISNDQRFEVTLITPEKFKGSLRNLKYEAEPSGSKINLIPVPCYFTQKIHLFFYHPFILKKIIQQKFDLIHIWEEPYILSGYQIAKLAQKSGTPYLFWTAQSLIKKYIYPFNIFENYTLKHSKAWVACADLVFKAMVEKGFPSSAKIIPLAVDTNLFKPLSQVEKIERQNNFNLSGPVIGYLGRLSEEKGLDLIMAVFSQLKNQKWNLLIMGSGPYEEKIKTWIKKEGFSERVTMKLLKHDEVPSYLPLCDLLLAPSQTRSFWKEQFGRMIVEAFASGVKVFASDSGEIPNVVGDAGLILPEDDLLAWKTAISEFLINPRSFDEYEQKALRRAQIYSAGNIAEQYKDLYQQLTS